MKEYLSSGLNWLVSSMQVFQSLNKHVNNNLLASTQCELRFVPFLTCMMAGELSNGPPVTRKAVSAANPRDKLYSPTNSVWPMETKHQIILKAARGSNQIPSPRLDKKDRLTPVAATRSSGIIEGFACSRTQEGSLLGRMYLTRESLSPMRKDVHWCMYARLQYLSLPNWMMHETGICWTRPGCWGTFECVNALQFDCIPYFRCSFKWQNSRVRLSRETSRKKAKLRETALIDVSRNPSWSGNAP